MELEKFANVVLGGLEDLYLANVAVLEGVDTLGSLLDLSANDLGNELVNELLEIARGSLALDDLEHLRTDLTDLSRLGVGGLLNLVGSALGETNGEETDEVAIGGLDVRVGLDKGLPLANERTKLVRSEVHTVEVGKTVLALNLIDAKLDLSESVLVVLVEIGERKFEDSSLEGVVGVLQTGRSVDEGLTDVTGVEHGRGLEVVPILASEGVDNALLDTLFAFREALVLTDSCSQRSARVHTESAFDISVTRIMNCRDLDFSELRIPHQYPI